MKTTATKHENVPAMRTGLGQAKMNPCVTESGELAPPKRTETSFLLDWLSGGEANPRNIKGFPLAFEVRS
jgi:hypothetical protein